MVTRRPRLDCSLAVLARAPIPGLTKTRLIPRLGAAGAALFQAVCIRQALTLAAQVEVCERAVWCAPDQQYFQTEWGNNLAFELYTQAEGNLGARMLQAFRRHCPRAPTLLIGTDCPVLTVAELALAAAKLQDRYDAVVIPAEDGGYVLLGLRQPHPELFEDISWGGSQVLEETRCRLRFLRLIWYELPALWDVDRPEDFDRLLLEPIAGAWRTMPAAAIAR